MNSKRLFYVVGFFLVVILFTSCGSESKDRTKLPILGRQVVNGTDTTYHTIPNFTFVNQDSVSVSQKTFKDKIYVADFFFTSCRTICPVMKTQMIRVYEVFEHDPDVLLLSHTIDPGYDTVALLHDYANRLGVTSGKWHFVTGLQDSIYDIAERGYFAVAQEDKSEPDGFIHSGAFLLIDKERRIRGKYDGTNPAQVDQLIEDIRLLEQTYE